MNRRCVSNWELLEHTFHKSLRPNAKRAVNRKVLVRSSLNTCLLSNWSLILASSWSLRLAEGRQVWQRCWKLNRVLLLMTLCARRSHEKTCIAHRTPGLSVKSSESVYYLPHPPRNSPHGKPNLFLREVWLRLFTCALVQWLVKGMNIFMEMIINSNLWGKLNIYNIEVTLCVDPMMWKSSNNYILFFDKSATLKSIP